MSKPKRRQGSPYFYAQRAVPIALRGVVGNGPLWKSLGVTDFEKAKPLERLQQLAWDSLFAEARKQLDAQTAKASSGSPVSSDPQTAAARRSKDGRSSRSPAKS